MCVGIPVPQGRVDYNSTLFLFNQSLGIGDTRIDDMHFIIETFIGTALLYFLQFILGLVVPYICSPISIALSLIEKKIRKGNLPLYNTFRIDHFINFMTIGIAEVYISTYILKSLSWNYELTIWAILIIAALRMFSYDNNKGFYYELSIIGGEILGLLISYTLFVY